jgi:hypothetical protein
VTAARAALVVIVVVAAVSGCKRAGGHCGREDPQAVIAPDVGGVDEDSDGLDDDYEARLAAAYLPFIAHHPDDRCPLAGMLFRVHPHPQNPALVHIVYDQLYALDCGLDGHIGDDETFGATVDPSIPPPAGLVALVAISHQGTPCERVTTCGSCAGMQPFDLAADGRPVVYCSKDKHGSVVDIGAGCAFGSCLESCALPVVAPELPLVNAGEPDHPLIHDLTADGFVDEHWDESLQHFDPWSPKNFGGAGVVSGDLVDNSFVPPACTCAE